MCLSLWEGSTMSEVTLPIFLDFLGTIWELLSSDYYENILDYIRLVNSDSLQTYISTRARLCSTSFAKLWFSDLGLWYMTWAFGTSSYPLWSDSWRAQIAVASSERAYCSILSRCRYQSSSHLGSTLQQPANICAPGAKFKLLPMLAVEIPYLLD